MESYRKLSEEVTNVSVRVQTKEVYLILGEKFRRSSLLAAITATDLGVSDIFTDRPTNLCVTIQYKSNL